MDTSISLKTYFRYLSFITIMGAHRSSPQTTKQTVVSQSSRLEVVATGMCGWRLYMEDSHICQTDLGNGNSLLAVFDGHGGPEVAGFVSKYLVEELTKNQNYLKKNYQQALIQTYMNLDRRLKTPQGEAELKIIRSENRARKNASDQQTSDAGCTAVTCLVTENEIYVANAGDSRCFVGIKNKAQAMSFDHKPDLPGQEARIKKAGGEVIDGRVNGNLNLSRAIGDLEYKTNQNIGQDQQLIISKPDVMKRALKDVQYIVLGCDGIFEVKQNQDIYDLILLKKDQPLKQTVEQITQLLLGKDTQGDFGLDNMTLIVAKLR